MKTFSIAVLVLLLAGLSVFYGVAACRRHDPFLWAVPTLATLGSAVAYRRLSRASV